MICASKRLIGKLPEDVQTIIRECKKEDRARVVLAEIEAEFGNDECVQQILPFVMEAYRDLKAVEEGFFASINYIKDLDSALNWVIETRWAIHVKLRVPSLNLAMTMMKHHPKFNFAEFL